MSTTPNTAMILAAGLATRMRPLTDVTAKPLLKLMGRSLLDHAIDRLCAAGVRRIVVNAHWHADQVAAQIAQRAQQDPEIRFILRHEDTLLETGGGVKAALADLGVDPFFVINGDAFWLNGPYDTLQRMAAMFDPARMDALLLVTRTSRMQGDAGMGDFMLDAEGRVRRRREREVVPYFYTGMQIAQPALFAAGPDGRFSTNIVWQRAIDADRLFAIVHDGPWFHLSTPADLHDTGQLLTKAAV